MGAWRRLSRCAHSQSVRGKLARSGAPEAKSASSRAGAAAGMAGSAGASGVV